MVISRWQVRASKNVSNLRVYQRASLLVLVRRKVGVSSITKFTVLFSQSGESPRIHLAALEGGTGGGDVL